MCYYRFSIVLPHVVDVSMATASVSAFITVLIANEGHMTPPIQHIPHM